MESLLSLKLDESESIGYTLKYANAFFVFVKLAIHKLTTSRCVGSGFWGLCSDRSFEDMVRIPFLLFTTLSAHTTHNSFR